jgi:hypothetical protein
MTKTALIIDLEPLPDLRMDETGTNSELDQLFGPSLGQWNDWISGRL